MRGRWLTLSIAMSLMHVATMYAGTEDGSAHNSSLKIDDEQLRELTVVEVANDLRAIGYIQQHRDEAAETERLGDEALNLQKNNLEFTRRIATLERSLSELDERYRRLLRSRQSERRESRAHVGDEEVYPPSLVYVLGSEPDLELVVLGAGARDGIRPGLLFRVVRDRQVLARLQVVIVRDRIAGAKVLEDGLRDFPGIGDEAVLGQPIN